MYDGRRRQRRSCLGCDKGNEKDCIGILSGGGDGFHIAVFCVYDSHRTDDRECEGIYRYF